MPSEKQITSWKMEREFSWGRISLIWGKNPFLPPNTVLHSTTSGWKSLVQRDGFFVLCLFLVLVVCNAPEVKIRKNRETEKRLPGLGCIYHLCPLHFSFPNKSAASWSATSGSVLPTTILNSGSLCSGYTSPSPLEEKDCSVSSRMLSLPFKGMLFSAVGVHHCLSPPCLQIPPSFHPSLTAPSSHFSSLSSRVRRCPCFPPLSISPCWTFSFWCFLPL